ncbi:MAG: hypothetical protein ABJA98_29350 [Acidobacteriota bacterium]
MLVAGFMVAGSTEIDTNAETVRLLRDQLRLHTPLHVIETDILQLAQIAAEQSASTGAADGDGRQEDVRGRPLRSEQDLEARRHVFANVAFWRQLGIEHQEPLIVTGTLHFTKRNRGGSLKLTVMFIDGRAGTLISSHIFRQQMPSKRGYLPALSLYYRLINPVLPAFLNAVTGQRVRSVRTVLR